MKAILLITTALFFNNCIIAQPKKAKKAKPSCIIAKNKPTEIKMTNTQKNVLGTEIKLASIDPMTGYFRTGYCNTDANDRGLHVVAAVVTKEFLEYSKSQGNDLMTPYPASNFPGLKPGNVWCLCVLRWKEALAAGVAPPVILEATNIKALDYVSLEILTAHKAD
jgi:uncharacterized protein